MTLTWAGTLRRRRVVWQSLQQGAALVGQVGDARALHLMCKCVGSGLLSQGSKAGSEFHDVFYIIFQELLLFPFLAVKPQSHPNLDVFSFPPWCRISSAHPFFSVGMPAEQIRSRISQRKIFSSLLPPSSQAFRGRPASHSMSTQVSCAVKLI